MKTLITGATGFMGMHLVDEMLRRGSAKALRAFCRGASAPLAARGVEVVSGSITSAADVARAIDDVTHVFHLAGHVSRNPDDAASMYQVHVEGTRLLCEAARVAKVKRIVLASSSGTVAVSRRADEMPDETSAAPIDIVARWPYYASKVYQEETARRACGDAVPLVICNPSLLLGPGDERLSSTRDVLLFLARDVPIVPGGGLNFVDVRDVAVALVSAMERGQPGERYLLGGQNWTFAEFFGRLERMTKVPGPKLHLAGHWPHRAARAQAAVYRALGRTPPVEPASVEMAQYFWYFNSDKAKAALGFEARDATDTLRDTVAYLRANVLGRRPLVAAG